MFKKILSILTLNLIMFSVINSLELRLTNSPFIIFKDGKLSPQFNFSSYEKGDCIYNQIYYEDTLESDWTRINVIKNETENFKPGKLYISNNSTSNFYIYKDNISGNNSIIDLFHVCNIKIDNWLPFKKNYSAIQAAEIISYKNSSKIYTEDETGNWCVIKFDFKYNDKIYFFEFIKLCKQDNFFIRAFSVCALLAIATLMTFASTSVDIKLNIIKEVREHNEIKWWHGIVFVILGSLVLILVFYFIKYLNFIYSILVTFQCFLCCYYTLCYIFKIKILKLKIFKIRILKIKIYKIICFLTSLFLTHIWFVSRHWILNNILAFCLVFVVLSLFSIGNFKVCMALLICVFIYDSFWVFFSSRIFSQNVMVTVATSLNLPIKIELPMFFVNNPIKNCMMLGLGDIVLPGMIIKYCKKFDKLKNNTNNYYYKSVMLLYVISLIVAFCAASIFNHAQPVLFYICPIFIFGLAYITCSNSDWLDFYNGKNLTGTQIVVEEIINGEFTRLDNADQQMTQVKIEGSENIDMHLDSSNNQI